LAGYTILYLLDITLLHKSLLVIVTSVAGIYVYWLHCQRKAPASIIHLILHPNNQWQIILAANPQPQSVTLLDSSMLTHYLMILNFRTPLGQYHSLILPSDAIDRRLARQIRARIRVVSL
jgi:hypothetical protein